MQDDFCQVQYVQLANISCVDIGAMTETDRNGNANTEMDTNHKTERKKETQISTRLMSYRNLLSHAFKSLEIPPSLFYSARKTYKFPMHTKNLDKFP